MSHAKEAVLGYDREQRAEHKRAQMKAPPATPPPPPSPAASTPEYERDRNRNVARNMKVLRQLGLG